MAFLSNPENMPLFLALLFVWLWYRTSPDSTYETVDLDTVSTRRVFLILAVGGFLFWLVVRLSG